jgi:hypothetical protein
MCVTLAGRESAVDSRPVLFRWLSSALAIGMLGGTIPAGPAMIDPIESPARASPARESPAYQRSMRPWDAVLVVVGGIIGGGIFLNPGIVAQRT